MITIIDTGTVEKGITIIADIAPFTLGIRCVDNKSVSPVTFETVNVDLHLEEGLMGSILLVEVAFL